MSLLFHILILLKKYNSSSRPKPEPHLVEVTLREGNTLLNLDESMNLRATFLIEKEKTEEKDFL